MLILALASAHPLPAQTPDDLARERAEFATWLRTAPLSPYAAIALQPIGAGVRLGPATSDLPLPGFGTGSVTEQGGRVWLERNGQRQVLPRGRPVAFGRYRLLAAGRAGRTVLAAYGPPRDAPAPAYYPPDPSLVFDLDLQPPERRGAFPVLGLDGLETEAHEAGFVTLPLASGPVRLRIYRLGSEGEDGAGFYLYFRDRTSGGTTYPSGRFVPVWPIGPRRFRIDFNRARNPFCAYSSVYPCPAQWPGNSIPDPIAAGELYHAAPDSGSG